MAEGPLHPAETWRQRSEERAGCPGRGGDCYVCARCRAGVSEHRPHRSCTTGRDFSGFQGAELIHAAFQIVLIRRLSCVTLCSKTWGCCTGVEKRFLEL